MIKIRRSVFETNSSSTHAICIGKIDSNTDYPKVVGFTLGEYGWEHRTYSDLESRASYLYTGIFDCTDVEKRKFYIDYIKNTLDKYNIGSYFQYADKEWKDVHVDYYVDHASELVDLFEYILADEPNLMRYLFGDTYIFTGNDNDDTYSEVCGSAEELSKDHVIIYKYN